ncbi:MAG: hypothetical protein ACRYHQ_19975, partial [Janthinobacterium lividum]
HHSLLLDFCRRLDIARRWAQAHADDYARVLAAEIGVSPSVARLIFTTDDPTPVPVDDQVIADEQKTADRFLRAKVIHGRINAGQVFDASFNQALSG